jgi:hypothetical protein
MTKITAIDIPIAELLLLETPKKGQIPKNLVKIILLTKAAEINRRIRFIF